jgi:hypothetical protein
LLFFFFSEFFNSYCYSEHHYYYFFYLLWYAISIIVINVAVVIIIVSQFQDSLALLYAGTRAMKTDFTRTGRRTLQGAMADGYQSVARYFLNNFYDGKRQDKIDLLLFRFSPGSDIPSSPTVMLNKSNIGIKLLVMLLVFIVTLFTCSFRRINGKIFVDTPSFVSRVVMPSGNQQAQASTALSITSSLEAKRDRSESTQQNSELQLKIEKGV